MCFVCMEKCKYRAIVTFVSCKKIEEFVGARLNASIIFVVKDFKPLIEAYFSCHPATISDTQGQIALFPHDLR